MRDQDRPASHELDRPVAAYVGDAYTPDLDALRIDPQNDPARALREAINARQPISLDVRCTAADGRQERFSLDTDAARAFLAAPLHERAAFQDALIRERRVAVCVAAIARLTERGQQPSPETLRPDEEAYLREFGALVDHELFEAREGESAVTTMRLREDFFTGDFDPPISTLLTTTTSQDSEYTPRGGPALQQLFINDVWDMQAKAWWAWHHDPMAKRGIAILRNFVLGRGVQIIADDDEVQIVIDDHASREKLQRRLKTWVTNLSRDGEIFLRKIRPGDGTIRHRTLPPETIAEVITDADDAEFELAIVQRYQTRTQVMEFTNYPQAQQRYIHREIRKMDYHHHKINASDEDVRGRSDLFVSFPWLKRLRDYFDALVQKEQAAAAYQWDYEIDGGPADIAKFRATLPTGKVEPGSFFLHNSKAKVSAVTAGGGGGSRSGSNVTYDTLLNHIAVGFGIAAGYLGAGQKGNRAGELVSTEPSAKEFEDRQDIIAELLSDVVDDVIREARRGGRLDPAKVKKGYGFRLSFPSITKSDAQTRQTMINRAESMGHLSKETAAGLVYGELDLEGVQYGDGTDGDELSKILAERTSANDVISVDLAQVRKGGQPAVGDPAIAPPEDDEINTDAGDKSPSSIDGAAKIRKELGREGARLTRRVYRNGQAALVIMP